MFGSFVSVCMNCRPGIYIFTLRDSASRQLSNIISHLLKLSFLLKKRTNAFTQGTAELPFIRRTISLIIGCQLTFLLLAIFVINATSIFITSTAAGKVLRKRIVLSDWYVCGSMDRPGNDPTVLYFRVDVENAVREGYRNVVDVTRATSSHNNAYPHSIRGSVRDPQYRNLHYNCRDGVMSEFPHTTRGFRGAMDDGLDRVIFDTWNG